MNWPNSFLITVLVGSMVAIVVPWLLPGKWRKFGIASVAVPCAVTLLWLLYEQQLKDISRPGDPLIRIDLFLIIPLVAIDWISAAASIAFAQLKYPKPRTSE